MGKTQHIIDMIDGKRGTFSLEGPKGKSFHTRPRVFQARELGKFGKIGL